MNSKRKGNTTEALLIAEFVKRNIPVLIPFGDAESYDLVVEIKNNLYKIQCKTCRLYNGVLVFNTTSTSHNTKINNDDGYEGKIDFFATIYDNIPYLIPIKVATKSKMGLRLEKPKNSQKRGVIWAYNYELDKILKDP